MARDCTQKPDSNTPGATAQQVNFGNSPNMKGFDSEYANLMAELGESGKGADNGRGFSAGHDITAGGTNVPPWRRPEMWQSTTPNSQPPQNQGYRPPQAGYGPGYGGAAGYNGYGAQQWSQAGYGGQGYPQQDYSAAYAQYYQSQYNQMQQ